MTDINVELHQWLKNVFDKKTTGTSIHTGTGMNFEKQKLADELLITITKRKKRKVYSSLDAGSRIN